MPYFDARPPELSADFYPGATLTVELNWPAGELTGRTFTSTLDAVAMAVAVNGDTMTLEAAPAETAAIDGAADWALLEDLGGLDPEPVMVGTWNPSARPAGRPASFTIVTDQAVIIDVSVFTGGLTTGMFNAHLERLHRSYVHASEDWLDRLEALLALSTSRLVRVGVLGDSVGAGSWASDWRALGWVGVSATQLQAVHGDGGSGWIDCGWLPNIFVPGGGQVTETGAWTFVAGGVNGMGRRPTVAGNGATVTMPFRGTVCDIAQRRGSGFGSWTYNIDGTGAVSVSAANGTADIHTTTVTGLSAGNHSVTITATTGDCRIFGVRGRNTTGLLFDNLSQGGRAWVNASAGAVPVTTATEGISSGVNSTTLGATLQFAAPLDVLIVASSVNDSNAASAPIEPILDVLGQVWDTARQMGPTLAEPPLLVKVIGHVGRHDSDSTPEYPKHAATYRGWADGVGAAVVDVWGYGRQSWDYWAGLGYWGIGNTDNVHPGDLGHAAQAALLVDLFTI